jgi:hypothetical protein
LQQYTKAEIEHIAETAAHLQGYVDWLEGKETISAGQAKLYEELKKYDFVEIDKIYEALRRGIGGKTFLSPTHKAIIKNKQLKIEKLT